MTIQVYDSAARKKREFEPIDPQHVKFYVCGPTVYDFAHIGNARPVVVFDVLYRVLRHDYPRVSYVRNITDVDDKINAAAKETGVPIAEITEKTIAAFHQDMAALGCLDPDEEPRATAHIPAMIAMIETLIDKGHAYEAAGHVLFRVASMPEYGRFSGRDRDEMIAGARVEVAEYKEDPADFVLWKPSEEDQPGWDSPWGRGRPGWHIECSAMSSQYLGETFDIHGGGRDLIFPHHENEVAQSTCAHDGKPLANYWMHNGMILLEGEKMSKSENHYLNVRDALGEWPGELLRFNMLSTHYRQPLDWTEDGVAQAKNSLDRLYTALRHLEGIEPGAADAPQGVLEALRDDLNTPLAIKHLHDLAGAANKAGTDEEKRRAKAELLAGGLILGLLQQDPEAWFKAASGDGLSDETIEAMIERRRAAREDRNFPEADRIRDALAEKGVLLEDNPDGSTDWRRA